MGISQFNWLPNVIDFLYEFFLKMYLFVYLISGLSLKNSFLWNKVREFLFSSMIIEASRVAW